jgi:peptide deformylase
MTVEGGQGLAWAFHACQRQLSSGMTFRKIARLGRPVLLARAAPVGEPDRPEIQALIDDMLATMRDADGLGLAAPQVFEGVRVVVAREVADRADRGTARELVLINPELAPLTEELESGWEGCLSIPGLRGYVPRRRSVGYRALDRRGRPFAGEAAGLFARVLQHEVDHLDGILYLARLADPRHLAFDQDVPHLTRWIADEGGAG